MSTILEKITFPSKIRGYSTSGADTTSNLKANAGEEIRANIQFRVTIESNANVGNGDQFVVTLRSGSTYELVADQANFVDDGWRVGDVFTFTDNSGGGIGAAPGQIILLVQDNIIEFTLLAPLVANTYTDAILQLETELTTLRFNYNFTPLSESTDLVQKLLQSVQGFEYQGLSDLAFHAGVAFVPIRGNTGSSQAKRRIATANFEQFFEIEHDFIPIPSGIESQLVNLQNLSSPDPYKTETITYVNALVLGVGTDNATFRPLPLKRIANDSVGWRNENFNGGINDYVLDSISYEEVSSGDVLNVIEANTTTRITAVISRDSGTFVATDPIMFNFSYLPVESAYQSSNDDYQTTWVYKNIVNTIDGAPVTDGTLVDFSATLSANIVTISVDVSFTVDELRRIFDDGAYEIYSTVEDNALSAEASNKVNLKLDAARLTKNPDITGLSAVTKVEFYNHTMEFVEGVSTGNTSAEMWIEEGFLIDGTFELNTSIDLVEIDKMFVNIIAINTITSDEFTIQENEIPTITQAIQDQAGDSVQILNLNSTRGFLLLDSDQFNLLKITTGTFAAGVQPYNFQMGLKIPWQDWDKLEDVDPVFFNTSLLNNGLNKKTNRFSGENDYVVKIDIILQVKKSGIITDYITSTPECRIFDYDEDRNVTPEFTGNFLIEDENSVDIDDNFVEGENNKITTTFTDGVTKTTIDSFDAIVRLQPKSQGTDNSIVEISSKDGVVSDLILTPLAGETLLKKSIVSGDYTVECLVDGTKIDTSKYTLSAELFESLFVWTCPGGEDYYDALVVANGGDIDSTALYGINLTAYKQAIDDFFCAGSPAQGDWINQMVGMYLFTGGTAATHAINGALPGGFDLVFVGSPTQNSAGLSLNGSTQYAETGINAVSHMADNKMHISALNTVNSLGGTYMGSVDSNTKRNALFYNNVLMFTDFDTYNITTGRVLGSASVDGFVLGSRRSATDSEIYFDGVSQASIITGGGTRSSLPMFIGALNINSVPGVFAQWDFQFASTGDELTSTKVTSLHNAVAAFQTALNR